MAARPSVEQQPLGWLREQLAAMSPDLLRAMVEAFAQALMGAEADAVCGAPYGERSAERADCRNGYRHASRVAQSAGGGGRCRRYIGLEVPTKVPAVLVFPREVWRQIC